MRASAIVLVFLGLLLFSASAHALCMATPRASESEETVTVKIANTYFSLPETAFVYKHERVPTERRFVRLSSLKLPDGETVMVGLSVRRANVKESAYEAIIGDDVSVSYSGNDTNALSEKILPYLKEHASKEPPDTWRTDQDLVRYFNLQELPCTSNGFFVGLAKLLFKLVEGLFYDDYKIVIDGLRHRNSAIREAAARASKQHGFIDDNVRRLLVQMAKHDKAAYARAAAVGALDNFPDDPVLIRDLREALKNETDRIGIIYGFEALAKKDRGLASFGRQHLPQANEEFKKNFAGYLAGLIEREYRKKYVATFDDFSSGAKFAYATLLEMLASDEDMQSQIIQYLECCGPVVATPEYIAYLNRVALEGPLNLSYVAIYALDKMRLKPEHIPEILIRFQEQEGKYMYKHIATLLSKQ